MIKPATFSIASAKLILLAIVLILGRCRLSGLILFVTMNAIFNESDLCIRELRQLRLERPRKYNLQQAATKSSRKYKFGTLTDKSA